MIKNVLLADDDRQMRGIFTEGLGRYRDTFTVVTAEDGASALEILRRQSVSLVVTDLKMPRVDGFALLTTIMEHYPDIPVIIITGYSTPEMEQLARRGGAVDYIAKPFTVETLARQIIAMLRRQSEGGLLHSVSSGMFLQLVEMEQKTCTIRLSDKSSGRQGALFFAGGVLMEARVGERQGEAAAREIFGWDQASLSIQNDCAVKENRIGKELNSLILEAARLKDEAKTAISRATGRRPKAATGVAGGGDFGEVRARISAALGPRSGVEGIYRDAGWDRRIEEISAVGEDLGLGRLVVGYLDRGSASDFILCSRKEHFVIAVKPDCSRDTLLQLLGE
jgi:DNA-binding response OmpR family regulator